MKRSPLKRSAPLRRKVAVRKFNRKRLAKRREAQFGEQAELCRWLPCCACAARRGALWPEWVHWASHGDSRDPHHEPTRARGGVDRHTVPLCRAHHDERHRVGEQEFCREYGIDLRGLAADIHAWMEERNGNRTASST